MKRVIVWLLIAALLLPCSALAIHPAFFASSGQSFYAPLTTTLVQTLGAGSPTFTRTTTAWVRDFEGLFKQVKSGEARFRGARRVENLLRYPEDFSQAQWTKSSSVSVTTEAGWQKITFANDSNINNLRIYQTASAPVIGDTVRIRIEIRYEGSWPTDGIRLYVGNQSLGDAWSAAITQASIGSGSKLFSGVTTLVALPGGRIQIMPVTANQPGHIYVRYPQLETVTGQTNTNPSEYVSTDVLSSPFHGANVAGVKYFDYQNGNTVDGSGVVTEAKGAAISASTLQGVFIEGQRTNYAIWTNDLTNAAWTKTDMTTAFTATGPAGIPNNATILTATAANATATQSITRTSAQRVTGVFLKRRTGTGTISITQDNGATWTDVTITSAWALYSLPAATLANPVIGIRIATSGDAVDATWWQHKESAFVSSPIPNNSATASVTRNADVSTRPTAGNWNTNNMSGVMQWTPLRASMGTVYLSGLYVDANNSFGVFHDGTNITVRKRIGGTNYDATYALAYTAGTTYKIGWRISASSGVDVFVNGVKGTNHSNTTALSSIPANFGIGQDGNSANYGFSGFKNAKIWKRALPDSRMIQETTP